MKKCGVCIFVFVFLLLRNGGREGVADQPVALKDTGHSGRFGGVMWGGWFLSTAKGLLLWNRDGISRDVV